MGSLRTIYAISVVFAHSYGYVFVGARNAVQLFYFISGFLISYVLVESKNYSNRKDFYINRLLRLFPIYYVVALLTLFTVGISYFLFKLPTLFSVWQQSPIAAKVLLTLSNIFMFGQDWVMFSGIDNGNLVFTTNFRTSEIPLWRGLIVPQAWTLGVELSFYLIAPFILFNRKIIFILLILSITLRAFLIKIGIGLHDPWTYRFFPTELALFLIGSLSHQILYPFYKRTLKSHIDLFSKLSTYFLIIISVIFFKIPLSELYKTLLLFALFAILLPLTFSFNNKNKWDRYIGDLSYPIYICHVLVIMVVMRVSNRLAFDNAKSFALICVVLSISLAITLNALVGKHVEAIRNKFRFNILKPTQQPHV
jgi:peptidoglycan/LPS O-acetylase OafA/YrhL